MPKSFLFFFNYPCARQCDNNFAAFTLGLLQTQSVFVRVQTHCEKPISVKSRSLGAVDRPLGPSGTQGPICSTECVILSQQACHSSNHSNTHSFLESGLSGQSSRLGVGICREVFLFGSQTLKNMLRETSINVTSGLSGVLKSHFYLGVNVFFILIIVSCKRRRVFHLTTDYPL